MKESFPTCLAFTLLAEGGWSDNPDDPGGETNKGITLTTFRDYHIDATANDLKAISDADVSLIYRTGYWRPVRGDDLPTGVDLTVFDFGVNAGPARSVHLLQTAVGVTADGILGPVSVAAIAKASPSETIAKLAGLQKQYYERLPTFGKFGRGWTARTERRASAALQLTKKPRNPK